MPVGAAVLILTVGVLTGSRSVWADEMRLFADDPSTANRDESAALNDLDGEGRNRRRTTATNIVRLEAARADVLAGREARLLLNLMENVEFEAVFDRSSATMTGFALSGRLATHGASSVTVVLNGDVLAGTIWAPDGTFRISGTAERTVIRQLGPGMRCHLEPLPSRGLVPTTESRRQFVPSQAVASTDEEAVIDLLVVYPPSVRRLEGGHRAMRALVDHDVAAANDAYLVSGAMQSIELVAAVEVDYRAPGMISALDDLVRHSGHLREAVDELVDLYQADLVYLHMGTAPDGLFGVAGAAYSFYDPTPEEVARYAYTVGYSSAFVHELGHIMGLKHERADNNTNRPFPYSHGYVFPDPADAEKNLCTMMGATLPCLPRFSNPEQTYPDEDGVPLGVPGDEPTADADGPADAVRHLNELRQLIADVRPQSAACSYTLSPAEREVPVEGGSYTVALDTGADCAWTVRSLDHAVSVTGSASGTGSSEVEFHVAANADWERELGLAVAGEVHIVRQAAGREMTAVCSRSPGAVLAIEAKVGKSCAQIGSDDLARIDRLEVMPHFITVRAGDFDGMSGLGHLEISKHWVVPYRGPAINIERRTFAGLANLTNLRMENVDVVLAAEAFRELVNLERLVISGAVDSFPDGAFAGLDRLDTLILNVNRASKLPLDTFRGLRNLRDLTMRGNKSLTTLEPSVFSALENLERLDLGQNALQTLPLGVFDGLANLEHLALFDNRLRELKVGLFDGLGALDYLWLSDNLLADLDPGVFRDLPELEIINLTGNRLEKLGPGVFDGLDNLTSLNLKNNRLGKLEEGIFEHCCRTLNNLYLDYNELTSLPPDIYRLPALRILDLRYNRLAGVSTDDLSATVEVKLEQRTRTRTMIPVFMAGRDPTRQSYLRLINYFPVGGDVEITAIDDSGTRLGPVTLGVQRTTTVHINSDDLETGNAAKGLPDGTGPASGELRLEIETDLEVEALVYLRTRDGFVTAMHDVVPVTASELRVVRFGAANGEAPTNRLRVMNASGEDAIVRVSAVDDNGNPAEETVAFSLPPHGARSLTAADLEAGSGDVEGALGDGEGHWRLNIESEQDVLAVHLLEIPAGQIANLSTVATRRDDGSFVVPLFPAASDKLEGVVRVVNDADTDGTVRIVASDASDWNYDPIEMTIGANRGVEFSSDDLELGNPAKGLEIGTGAGEGDWRLELASELPIRVAAYIRTSDGLLASMHDLAPRMKKHTHRLFPPRDHGYRVVSLNPGRNTNQVGFVRMTNAGREAARLRYTGFDDAGEYRNPISGIRDLLPGETRIIPAVELEQRTYFRPGVGKWQVQVDAARPIEVMSLMRNPTGHLANLSTGTLERRAEVDATDSMPASSR